MKIPCDECYGHGEIMLGAWPHPNPSSYSDYDEIWDVCPDCKGSGSRYMGVIGYLRYMYDRINYKLRYLHYHFKQEEELPF